LDEYAQVTSPLRRYTDLLAHQQIRSYLGAGLYQGNSPRGEEELLLAVSTADAGLGAANQAERASRSHWLGVYLLDKKDVVWDAVVMEKKGNRAVVMIPALGLETQVSLKNNAEPNDPVRLTLVSVKIPEGELIFSSL
jgi:exoribonuclease-2